MVSIGVSRLYPSSCDPCLHSLPSNIDLREVESRGLVWGSTLLPLRLGSASFWKLCLNTWRKTDEGDLVGFSTALAASCGPSILERRWWLQHLFFSSLLICLVQGFGEDEVSSIVQRRESVSHRTRSSDERVREEES